MRHLNYLNACKKKYIQIRIYLIFLRKQGNTKMHFRNFKNSTVRMTAYNNSVITCLKYIFYIKVKRQHIHSTKHSWPIIT